MLAVGYHSRLWRGSEGKEVCSHCLFSPLGGKLCGSSLWPAPPVSGTPPRPLPDPRAAGAEAIRFTLKREHGRQNPAKSASWQDLANGAKLLVLLDSVRPGGWGAGGAGPRERWDLQLLRPWGSCRLDVPRGFPPVRRVGSRCFEMTVFRFLFPGVPARGSVEQRLGEEGGAPQRRHRAEAPGPSSPLIGSSWDPRSAQPQPLSPSLRLALRNSRSQRGRCGRHTARKSLPFPR